MKSGRMARRVALVAGGGAIIAMGALTACSGSESPSPSSTTTTTTTTVAPTPTEKAITPGGPNSFSPSVLAPPAQTARPGNERNTGPVG